MKLFKYVLTNIYKIFFLYIKILKIYSFQNSYLKCFNDVITINKKLDYY